MGVEVAGVVVVDRREFLAARIESEELELGGHRIKPSHSLCCGPPVSCRDDHLESAEVTPALTVFAAVVEPEDTDRENAVDGCGRLGIADADHCIGRGPA